VQRLLDCSIMQGEMSRPTSAHLEGGRRQFDRVEEFSQPELLAAMSSSAAYPGHPPVVVHETHASWVFVAGARTYKIKKPLALGFLDYSSLARRHAACREEVRVNRDLAPGIYLGVRAILAGREGFRLAGEGASGAVEYAVEMRTFDERDTLTGLIEADRLTREVLERVARLLANFHRSAPVARGWGQDRVREAWQKNLAELAATAHPKSWRLDVVRAFADAFVEAHAAELRRRAALGLARDGHGDLRCEHVLAGSTLAIVDRVEFDPGLRRIDVACDLAFLTMDLEAHGHSWGARALVDAYRDAGLCPGSEQLRCFYGAHWALVRAKVALIAAAGRAAGAATRQLRSAQRLWSLSERLCWRARMPLAIVICGPAASGKSVLAAELARRSELPLISSDEVRRRLAKVRAGERGRPEHYRASFTRRTYGELAREAGLALDRGDGVLVDATCRSRSDRALLLRRLRASGARCLAVRCEVPLELALERATRRLGDPARLSDATPQIAEEQLRAFEEIDELPAANVLRLDTAQPLEDQLAELAVGVDAA
jgi:aminoglycoside phosphotransferase family enzyme/predicted kinase